MKFNILTCIIGFLAPTITNAFQRQIPVHVDTSYVKPSRPMKCYPDFEDSKIGLSYGVRHQMPGVDISSYIIRYRISLTSNVEWRMNRNNSYFDSKFIKHSLFNYGNTEFPVTAGYKRILQHSDNKIEQFYLGTGIFNWGNGLLIGYARGSSSSYDFKQRVNNGVLVQLYNELFYSLCITTTIVYWFDEFQYSLKFTDGIYANRIFVGATLEKIGDWNEMSVSLLFSM